MEHEVPEGKLESLLNELFREHVSQLIEKYVVESPFEFVSEASAYLGYPKKRLGQWYTKVSTPDFKDYFLFRLNMKDNSEEGLEARQNKAGDLYCNLLDFVLTSVDSYLEVKGRTKVEFRQDSGVAPRTIRSWRSPDIVVSRKQAFMCLSTIYKDYDPRNVMYYIANVDALQNKEYLKLIDTLAMGPVEVKSLGKLKNLRELKRDPLDQNIEYLSDLVCWFGPLVEYFGEAELADREFLRSVCKTRMFEIGSILAETRSLLDDEQNYQNYRQMNE
jgi:hypothetical protein